LLDYYDHENLDQKGQSMHQATYPELPDYQNIIEAMRSDFESSVFGKEKDAVLRAPLRRYARDLEMLTFILPSKKRRPLYSI
jgi:hypothetical protein